ncbi:MAG: radical SAM protein [Chloroflexi bacterium]|nr:radical SAM protein [Chloroflexota bacterium]
MTDQLPASSFQPPTPQFDACGERATPADAYDALLGRLRAEHVPYTILWELTHRCNLACVMCYNVSRAEPELTTAECLDVLAQLAAAGALRLTLTGGEILTRRDFFTIAGRARALGFALDLKTNGTLLTPDAAERVADLDPVQVDISLLGATVETSDAVMGGRDTLRRILRGVRLLQERGVRVKLNTLLLDLNLAECQAMLDIAQEFGVYYEQTFKISPNDDGRLKAARYQLSTSQMTGVLLADRTPFLPKPPAASRRTCQVGLASCLVSPYGVVYPCNELRIPAGRLVGERRQRFADIWADAPILRQLRSQHTFANLPDCRGCPLAAYCEGRCAGLAWKERGDPYAGHSLACRHAQARYAEQHLGMSVPETPVQAWILRARDTESHAD